MLIRIRYGWAKVLSGPIEFGGIKGYMLRLTENSCCPGKVILHYPERYIRERDI